MSKTVKCICLKPDGSITLVPVTLKHGKHSLEFDSDVFDCDECGCKSGGVGSTGPFFFQKEAHCFSVYDRDSHKETCSVGINPHSRYFFSASCGCGGRGEDHSHYRGPIYLVKYDLTRPRINHPPEWFKHAKSYEELASIDNTTDATEADIEYIRKKIE